MDFSATAPMDLQQNNFFAGDVKVMSSTDNAYSSHLGAIGANNNEASMFHNHVPINVTSKFP